MAKKSVESKRKIISLIRNKDPQGAVALFFKNYNENQIPELEFIKNIYIEFNRFNFNKEAFELLAQVGVWYPDDADFQDIFENCTNSYVGQLILQGNNLKFQRQQKEYSFEESLKKADSLTKEKLKIENEKLLKKLNDEAKERFELALRYSPTNTVAYKGLADCYRNEKNNEKADELEQKIVEITTEKFNKYNSVEQALSDAAPKKEQVYFDDYSVYEGLFNEKKYEELYELIDKNRQSEYFPPEALLLKARALVAEKKFLNANVTLNEAEQAYSDFKMLTSTKEEIDGIKYALYTKAGATFLKKAINLGFPLGKESFERAKFCLLKALEIKPEELNILDQAYTCLKYLGDNKEAFNIKARIFALDATKKLSYETRFENSMCFIATYTYYDQPHLIDEFRWFRREYLLNNKFGRRINSLYINLSSRITKAIIKEKVLRYIFKFILYFPLIIIRLLKLISRNNKN